MGFDVIIGNTLGGEDRIRGFRGLEQETKDDVRKVSDSRKTAVMGLKGTKAILERLIESQRWVAGQIAIDPVDYDR